MIFDEDDYLQHYGTPRHSGRYPWGSGKDPRHAHDFLSTIDQLKKTGMSEKDIAEAFELTTTQLRAQKTIAKNAAKQADISMAQRLKDKGYSNVAIGERMGKPESTIRTLLAPGAKDKADILLATSNAIRDRVDNVKYLDIGKGTENYMGISKEKLNAAVAVLQEQGYKVQYIKVDQLGTGHQTTVKVLTKDDVPWSELNSNKGNIQQIQTFSEDGGRTMLGLQPPLHIDSSRIAVRYAENGGTAADGVIYVRPGVKDISLDGARYAQVRVAVDGTHYLKGMAMYKDDLPKGVDLMFNTNKSDTGNKLDALKPLKLDKATGQVDKDNPFGSSISRQIIEKDPKTGKDVVTSAMNIVNEEGDWDKWSKTFSSQMLSKQSPLLAKQQLDLTYANKKADLDEIMSLTNPAVKKQLLDAFADGADTAAVHLKAASLPRTAQKVILPIESMKPTEIYAPSFRDGERVALIRHPHGGKFEIPELTVNNKNPQAKKILGTNAKDAVGIHSSVAARLSGADFDGDTVLVIPNNSGKIKSEPALEGLKGFDPQSAYPAYDGMPKMSSVTKQAEMGKISNLITDMTIKGASNTELAAAVRHSMVVIDAEKHNLNYKQSAIDNGIAALKKKYQGKANAGASTLISNSGVNATIRVPARKVTSQASTRLNTDPTTGKRLVRETGESYVNAQGKTIVKTEESSKLAEVDDVHVYSSGTPIEKVYGDYSNSMKDLANQARKASVNLPSPKYSESAAKAYKPEVDELTSALNIAQMNSPRERAAQIMANAVVSAKKAADPELPPDDLKKIKTQALTEARSRTGASKQQIEITPKQWEAIQAGAVRPSKLTDILSNTDLDHVKELAMPKTNTVMTASRTAQANALLARGYTQAEVADQLGISVSTLHASIERGDVNG